MDLEIVEIGNIVVFQITRNRTMISMNSRIWYQPPTIYCSAKVGKERYEIITEKYSKNDHQILLAKGL